MGRGRDCVYSNAIEKLFGVTCVLTLRCHDDPKNDLDERCVWSDVTISMSLSVSLCLSLFVCVCVCAREGDRTVKNLMFLAIEHRP